jgi:hypothetical protein
LVSQAVMDDAAAQGGRRVVLARLDDGYIGWIQLARGRDDAYSDDFARRATHHVAVNHSAMQSGPSDDALR